MASKKLSDFGIKAPSTGNGNALGPHSGLASFSKWVPLICAGAAVGVSILALKEIKNVRKEIVTLKKDKKNGLGDSDLTKKIELMDEQLRKITQYLAKQNVVKGVTKDPIQIINESEEEEIEEVESEEETEE